MSLESYQRPQPIIDSIAAVLSKLPGEEWRVLQTAHPNMLFAGTHLAVNTALVALQPALRLPLVTWHVGDPLVLPPLPSSGTLILQDVDALSRAEQQLLLGWLHDVWGTIQVVSTTELRLFRLVERGQFLDALYYRLNVVYVEVAL